MQVIGLIGTSRCGSTVLQAALAQFRDVAALGEVKRLHRLATTGASCSCGAKVSACEVWGAEAPGFIASSGSKLRMIGNALATAARTPMFAEDAKAAQSLSRTLRAIAKKLPARVFVDSSKDLDQLLLYATLPDIEVIPVHVVRDPRGVVQSAGRRTGIAPDEMTRHWRRLNGATIVLRKLTPHLPWQTVLYEDFCTDPAGVCQRVLRAAGHDGQMRDEPALHHTLGGSPGFSFAGVDAIRVEENWRTTMPKDLQTTILRQSGWPAKHLGYRD